MRLFVRVYIEASFLGLLVSVIPWGPLSDDFSETKVFIVVNLSLTQHAVKITCPGRLDGSFLKP